jgi:hypothetical protein
MGKRSVFGHARTVRENTSRVTRISGPALLAGLILLAGVPAATAQATGAANGSVYVVQGLPGQTVDIAVDGRKVASGVAAAKVVGPFSVAAGKRKLTATAGGKTVLERNITVGAGSNSDVVIHRPASPTGAPVVTTYRNKLEAVASDKGAIRVAHTAAVPPADIRVNGKVLFANVANGESLDLVVPAATYTVDIVPTGTNGPRVLGPAQLPIKARSLTRVFAIGEPKSGTMNVAVGVITLPKAGTTKPTQVDTGTGGQAAAAGLTEEREGVPAGWLVLAAALLTVAVGFRFRPVRRTVRR